MEAARDCAAFERFQSEANLPNRFVELCAVVECIPPRQRVMFNRSRLEQHQGRLLRCPHKLLIETGQRQAFAEGDVEISGIVNGQALAIGKREYVAVETGSVS